MNRKKIYPLINKNLILVAIAISGFFVLTSSLDGTESTGAPAVSSGAPDEKDCTTSGCHDDGVVNSGPGIISLEVKNNETVFEKGKVYSFTAKLSQENIVRFGFEVLAIDENGNNAGEFLVTDLDRTQIFPGYDEFINRRYLTYKYAGTDPYETGVGQWTFDWKAPENIDGKVKFYMAALSANNDGTDDGDEVYTTELELASSALGITSKAPNQRFQIFPNPMGNHFNLSFSWADNTEWNVAVIDYTGKVLFNKNYDASSLENSIDVQLDPAIPSGVYLVTISNDLHVFSKKIIVSK